LSLSASLTAALTIRSAMHPVVPSPL